MRRYPAIVAAFVAGGLGAATPVRACSMAPGYRVPTNLELAAAADMIVVAEVVGERTPTGSNEPWDRTVLVRPTMLLKGASLPRQVELPGAYLSGDRRAVMASAPRELRQPNPGALTGGCVRYTFALGMKLVLFLKRDADGALKPYRSPFSRDAEDVVGIDALWVKAVREYAAISSLPRSEWRAALARRISVLRAGDQDADTTAIASDMATELSGQRLPSID